MPAPAPPTRPRIVAVEAWLPLVIGMTAWVALYPGLFGEDSLITLTEARGGGITAWFTAWWIIVIDVVSLGTRAIPLVTLAGVLLLTWAIRQWATACLPAGPARAWAVVIVCATPMVWALGIQVRHDAWMTAGLLLCVTVVTRTGCRLERFRAVDYAQLAAAVLLIPTRHNGIGTLVLAAAGSLWWFGRDRLRHAATFAFAAAGVFAVTQSATRAVGLPHSVDPAQTVEWLMADVSCLLSEGGIEPSAEEWAALERVARREDWPQSRACNFVSPLFIAPSFRTSHVDGNVWPLAKTWLSLARRYPIRLALVHLRRIALFLPPFIVGVPDQNYTPFIHSTILPNDFGLAWMFPAAAELVRQPARAWNAMRLLLANSAIWLAVLVVAAWVSPGHRARLRPTILVAVALNLGLIATAPISEGRYGLFILICGQLTALQWWCEARSVKRAVAA